MKKQYLIVNLILTTILLSCSPLKKKGLLSCILDNYIVEFNYRLGNEISLAETVNWSDSTSLISILSIKSKSMNSGTYWYTEYEKAKIYIPKKTENVKMESNIMEGLIWRTINLENNPEEGIVPPEQFDEVQIIYNPIKKCIEGPDMMGRVNFKEAIENKCGLCE